MSELAQPVALSHPSRPKHPQAQDHPHPSVFETDPAVALVSVSTRPQHIQAARASISMAQSVS